MDPLGLLIVSLLLLVSALFSACETAIISISPARVRALADQKLYGSYYLKRLKDNEHKTLITILLWNNLLNIAASAYTTVILTVAFGPAGIGIATASMTVLILIFGEIIPKTVASKYAKNVLLFFSAPLFFLEIMIRPIIWLLDLIVKLFFKIFGANHEKMVSDEELIAMVSIGEEEGTLEKNEKEFIENVLSFNDIRVEEIMTHRVHVDAMPEDLTVKQAAEFMVNHSHTRIPVYRDTIDNIVGIITHRELLEHFTDDDIEKKLRQVTLRNPLKIAQSMLIDDLFVLFNKQHRMMAIVLDEHGGTAGLITMEDLLEELVGEIVDESDIEEDEIRKLDTNEYEITGKLHLDQLAEITGLVFEYPEYKTVNFLLIEKLGHIPKKGEKLHVSGWEFTVTQLYRSTVLKVHLKRS